MEKLAEKPWSWTLFKADAGLILSVLSGGAAMFEVNVTLSAEEAAAWEAEGEAGLKPLITEIQRRPRDFKDRHVPLPS